MPIGATGALIDGEYTVESALRLISGTQAAGSDPGPTVRTFSARQAKQARLEKPAAGQQKKTGAVVGIYDPELSALLAGEV
jgi:hypothetical protein